MIRKKILIIFILIVLGFPFYSFAKKEITLSGKYKKFLDEVSPIITKKEKKVFLSLKTDKERDDFIKLFWAQRDPVPLTPENEYKEEYYKRLKYVNAIFGREEGTKGWKTERGRIYLLLGKPKFIDRYDGMGRLYPIEVWFYSLPPKYGLPANFYLVFYKPPGYNGYKLYSPNFDGPAALIGGYSGDPTDYYTAYEYIKNWEPQLAPITISLIPEKQVQDVTQPPPENIALLSGIEKVPYKIVDENYAERFFNLKPYVNVDYTTKYVESKSTALFVPYIEKGVNFLDIAVQPDRFSIENYKGKYYSKFQVVFKLISFDGKDEIFNSNEDYYLTFTKRQVEDLKRKKVVLLFRFPIGNIGRAKYILFVKNYVSNEYFVSEGEGNFGNIYSIAKIYDIGIVRRIRKTNFMVQKIRPFSFGNKLFYPMIDKEIYTKNKGVLVVFGKSSIEDGKVEVYIGDKKVLGEKIGKGNFVIEKTIENDGSLIGFKKVKVNVVRNGIIVDTKEIKINFSPLVMFKSPIFLSFVSKSSNGKFYYYLGKQYDRKNDFNNAYKFFEKAFLGGESSAVCELAKYSFKKNDIKKALGFINKCELHNVETEILRGYIYLNNYLYEDALKICRELRKNFPNNKKVIEFCKKTIKIKNNKIQHKNKS